MTVAAESNYISASCSVPLWRPSVVYCRQDRLRHSTQNIDRYRQQLRARSCKRIPFRSAFTRWMSPERLATAKNQTPAHLIQMLPHCSPHAAAAATEKVCL